jgi:hypothetical protein
MSRSLWQFYRQLLRRRGHCTLIDGSYRCGRQNTTCCGGGDGVFLVNDGHTLSYSAITSLLALGSEKVSTCPDAKGSIDNESTDVIITPCSDGTYCCGDQNTTCCNGGDSAFLVNDGKAVTRATIASLLAMKQEKVSVRKLGIGLGIGLGIPLLIAIGVISYLVFRIRRGLGQEYSDAVAVDHNDLPPTFTAVDHCDLLPTFAAGVDDRREMREQPMYFRWLLHVRNRGFCSLIHVLPLRQVNRQKRCLVQQ